MTETTNLAHLFPDWWLDQAAKAMRKSHYRILNRTCDPLVELVRLQDRIGRLLEAGERQERAA